MDINGKIYQLVKIIEFIWSQYTSLTYWVVMSKNMKVAADIDLDKLKNFTQTSEAILEYFYQHD